MRAEMKKMGASNRARAIQWMALMAMVALVATLAVAQEPPPPPPHGGMMMGGPGPMGVEFGDGKTIKGAPLTAVFVTIRETTLSDGNRIHNETQSKVYRDADGRVRREMGVDLATPATGPVKHNLVVITDPVAGTRSVLNPDNKTARQMPMHDQGQAGKDHPAHQRAMGEPGEVSKEQLGTKTVNGVEAEGVRVTRTIPAGTMGNERAIAVVTERWYSPDLQIVVLTTHTDPMMGTVTTKLLNMTQGAPDASLFQLPSDYAVEKGKRGDPMYLPTKPQ
jgi:hypothetical protein